MDLLLLLFLGWRDEGQQGWRDGDNKFVLIINNLYKNWYDFIWALKFSGFHSFLIFFFQIFYKCYQFLNFMNYSGFFIFYYPLEHNCASATFQCRGGWFVINFLDDKCFINYEGQFFCVRKNPWIHLAQLSWNCPRHVQNNAWFFWTWEWYFCSVFCVTCLLCVW